MIITLDGGSASGKTTLAREVSKRFDIPLLESGHLYRAVTLRLLEAGVSAEDTKAVEKFVTPLSLEMKEENLEWRLVINGKLDDPKALRRPEVSEKVSLISRIPLVRRRLLSLQRSCYSRKRRKHLIAEGRDLGTAVFPHADIKVFLKVSEELRAKRRKDDFAAMGLSLSEWKVGRMEAERDRIDRERETAPLRIPQGAVILETTGKTVSQSFRELIRLINVKKHSDNFIYSLVRALTFVPWFYLKLRWEGREHIPQRGGFILASNHLSNLDPVMLGFASHRTLSYVARNSLFGMHPLFAWLIRSLNAYPINRESPDRRSLIQIIRFLMEGHGVVYFPEGTRSRDGKLGAFKKGIGALSLRTAFPVIPACVSGTREAMPVGARGIKRGQVTVRFGPPVDFSDLYDKEFTVELYEKAAHKVREAILQQSSDLK